MKTRASQLATTLIRTTKGRALRGTHTLPQTLVALRTTLATTGGGRGAGGRRHHRGRPAVGGRPA